MPVRWDSLGLTHRRASVSSLLWLEVWLTQRGWIVTVNDEQLPAISSDETTAKRYAVDAAMALVLRTSERLRGS